MMKTKFITIVAVVILLSASQVQAVNVDFYTDSTIEDGAIYNMVRIYDTPPETTTVDMFGGSVGELRAYDSSIVNVNGGELRWSIDSRNSSTVNIYAGSVILNGVLNIDESSTLNVYGGVLNVGNSPIFDPLSKVNIYGYDFNFDGFQLTGFLLDDSSFIIRELSLSDYEHINLIPEPATFILFGLGALLLRTRNKNQPLI